MLGKLMKYEWKSLSKICSIMLLSIAVVTVIGCVLLSFPGTMAVFSDDSTYTELQTMALAFTFMISFMLYMFMLVGITYGIMIYIGVHFYKTMYTDQGYLSHTLPVTPNQLFLSKTLTSGLWYMLIMVATLISIFALIFSFAAGMMGSEGYSIGEMFAELINELSTADMEAELGMSMFHYCAFMLFSMLIGPFTAVIMIFGALTIGQLSKKYKAMMGILAYFGIMVINMIVNMIAQMVATIGSTVSMMSNPDAVTTMNMGSIYDSSMIVSILMAVILYFVSYYILNHKLNME
ncbi:MAG: hypothetical protein IJF07_03610 [Lachnospiraceae bacterium]|nr:hypothetical protein [Lachnospiraceae bacterium]